MSFDEGDVGFTVHCNYSLLGKATNDLTEHCLYRKYQSKASTWYGVLLCSRTNKIKVISKFDLPWAYSNEIPFSPVQVIQTRNQIAHPITHKKTGRNELCGCGSGLKFKKCCSS